MAVDRSQNRHVVIGVLIVIAAAALPILIIFVPDLLRSLTPSVKLVAVMAQAGPLAKGSPVWIAGHEVGVVTSVGLRPAGRDSIERIALELSVPRKYLAQVRKDSEIVLAKSRLVGAPALDILPGSVTSEPVQEGDTLYTRHASGLEEMIDATLNLSENFATLFKDLESLQEVTGNTREEQLKRLAANFTRTSTEFSQLMRTLETSPILTLGDPQFKRTLNSLSARGRELNQAFGAAAERARRAGSQAEPALRRLAARGDTISKVLAGIQARIEANGGGLLIRAQSDTAIIKALHEAQRQLDSLVAESKRNPLRFWL
jgi:phospholipid/cholesterol/gamma-HCH transport system substrate-binding protein